MRNPPLPPLIRGKTAFRKTGKFISKRYKSEKMIIRLFLLFLSVSFLETRAGGPPFLPVAPASAAAKAPKAPPAASSLSSKEREKALQRLRAVLQKYRNRNIYMKVTKKTHIAALQKDIEEKGDLSLSRGRFRLSISASSFGSSGSLAVFDGETLWFQPSRSEKIVLKLQKDSQAGLLSSLFDFRALFELFSVEPLPRQNARSPRLYILRPKKGTPFSHIVLSAGKNINGAQIVQAEGGDRQTFRFSGLWFKKTAPDSLFQFQTKGFEIVEKE